MQPNIVLVSLYFITYDCYCFALFKKINTSLDIDECLVKNGGCEHSCHNVAGSRQCRCKAGYRLSADKNTCEGLYGVIS